MSRISNISIYKGQSLTITIKRKDKNKKPIDITGYKYYLTVKLNDSVVDGSATLQKTVTSFSAPKEGICIIALIGTDTAITPGVYQYDITELDAATPKNKLPLVSGTFTVVKPITDATT